MLRPFHGFALLTLGIAAAFAAVTPAGIADALTLRTAPDEILAALEARP